MSQLGIQMVPGPNSTIIRDNSFQAMFQGVVSNVSYTATAGQSATFGANTSLIRIVATSDCYYLIGANPTATTANGSFLPLGVIEFPAVLPGQKISVLQSSASGSLNITQGL